RRRARHRRPGTGRQPVLRPAARRPAPAHDHRMLRVPGRRRRCPHRCHRRPVPARVRPRRGRPGPPTGPVTSGTQAASARAAMLSRPKPRIQRKMAGHPDQPGPHAMTLDFAKAREAMVEQQIRPWDVLDVRVLNVLLRLPREAYAPDTHRALAYADLALPLAHGETMTKPVVEGRALQALALDGTEDVLEIGTGSGFTAACLGQLARSVTTIERHADLAATAQATLLGQGASN